VRPDRRDLAGVRAVVTRNGAEVARTDAPEALIGRLLEVVTSMADTLGQVDERLLAGDVLITGAVVAPVAVTPGDRMAVELTGLGSLEVRIR
jgi:2-keto-4-pentenoate hydratase